MIHLRVLEVLIEVESCGCPKEMAESNKKMIVKFFLTVQMYVHLTSQKLGLTLKLQIWTQ